MNTQVSVDVFVSVFILQVYLHMHTHYIILNELLSVKVFSSEEVFPWRWVGHSSSKYTITWPQLRLYIYYIVLCFYVTVFFMQKVVWHVLRDTCLALLHIRHKHMSTR